MSKDLCKLPVYSRPIPERQNELEARYQENKRLGKAPYDEVQISTLGEVRWIMAQRDWHGEFSAGGKPRADFSHARFRGANLSGINLCQANLRHATFREAVLVGAHLEQAYLEGARFNGTDLTEAFLEEADLTGARFSQTPDGQGAKLSGAHLDGARLNGASVFASVVLDSATTFGDVVWGGVSLVKVDWSQLPILGDELIAVTVAERAQPKEKVAQYRKAARAYRGLALALRHQGLLVDASHYRLQELRLERRASFWEGKVLSWLFSWLLNILAGYGERPVRSFFAYITLIAGFAGLYAVLGPGEGHRFSLQGALVFSVTSFHGRGFFPGGPTLQDAITQLAALEAVAGLFVEISFIATFTQRYFSR